MNLDLVFIWGWNGQDAVITERRWYSARNSIRSARDGAETYGCFLNLLNTDAREFVEVFLKDVDDPEPAHSDRIDDIVNSDYPSTYSYLFEDSDFPDPQCICESRSIIDNLLGDWDDTTQIATEFGELIYVFDQADFLQIKKIIAQRGSRIEDVHDDGLHIYDYGT